MSLREVPGELLDSPNRQRVHGENLPDEPDRRRRPGVLCHRVQPGTAPEVLTDPTEVRGAWLLVALGPVDRPEAVGELSRVHVGVAHQHQPGLAVESAEQVGERDRIVEPRIRVDPLVDAVVEVDVVEALEVAGAVGGGEQRARPDFGTAPWSRRRPSPAAGSGGSPAAARRPARARRRRARCGRWWRRGRARRPVRCARARAAS